MKVKIFNAAVDKEEEINKFLNTIPKEKIKFISQSYSYSSNGGTILSIFYEE
uniref:Uncharacterized protein n=1 Tax=viral metagenome TaxID=1070528 RepID=A0A6M3ISR4_9ZZZZ